MPNAITDAERNQIQLMHAAGRSRNDIARELGRSPASVSKIVHESGAQFDRSTTAAATEAKQTDNKARRAALVDRLYGRAERIAARLDEPLYAYTTTTVNGIETKSLGHVPAQDERHLASALATHLTSAARLEQIDAEDAAAAGRSVLGGIAAALGIQPTGGDE